MGLKQTLHIVLLNNMYTKYQIWEWKRTKLKHSIYVTGARNHPRQTAYVNSHMQGDVWISKYIRTGMLHNFTFIATSMGFSVLMYLFSLVS